MRKFLRICLAIVRYSALALVIYLAYRAILAVFTLHNILFVSRYIYVSLLAFFVVWITGILGRQFLTEKAEDIARLGKQILGKPLYGVLIDLGNTQRFFELSLSSVSIGSSQENDLVLDSEYISGSHALIKTDGDRILLYDLDSTNGTFVNGEKVEADAEKELRDWDEVRFGPELRFRFEKA